ncbi:hypothetical protein [Alishewanella phage vB_AspM_Slickus01]|nr:hypothetical protein [Alishewanella phage vB_AspM_Slickus01]
MTNVTQAQASTLNLPLLKVILEQLNSLGISEAIIEPITDEEGNGVTRVRAGNKDHSIMIFDDIEDTLSDKALAISSIKGLQTRIALFSNEKSSVTVTNRSNFAASIEIKEGKRKASYTLSHPNIILAPKVMPDYEILGNPIVLSEDFISALLDVFASMGFTGKKEDRRIAIKSSGDEVTITVFDGESDSFVETFQYAGGEVDIPSTQWEVEAFKLALRKASETSLDKSVTFIVTDIGTAVMQSAPMSVIVAPVH